MATAVGAKNLPSVASLVARGIGQRAKKELKSQLISLFVKIYRSQRKLLKNI